jgi:excinuclease ABC subunit A
MEEVGELDKNKRHDIDIVIDRLIIKEGIRYGAGWPKTVELALDWGHGELVIHTEDGGDKLVSSNHTCPICGFSVPKLEPRLFSFNAPLGYCPSCKGLGINRSVALDLLIPDPSKTINQGAIRYYKNIRRDRQFGMAGVLLSSWTPITFLMTSLGKT